MRLARALASITFACAIPMSLSTLGPDAVAYAQVAGQDDSAPPATVPAADSASPPTTENPFLPENANIGDCISALPRPECGSTARGGWRQTLVFVMVVVGLVLIGIRLAFAIRKRQPSG